MSEPTQSRGRTGLTADRVVSGAMDLADRIGVDAFTIRRLAAALDVKPMTLYHHVPSKEAIIDRAIDRVFAEIALPPDDVDWRAGIRLRCVSARQVLSRHPWATPLMETRTSPGPANLHHHDSVLGCLRRGGLSIALTAHAYAILDSYIYGFALQEATLPFDTATGTDVTALAEQLVAAFPAGQYPHLVAFTVGHVLQPGYSFPASFGVGLDFLLGGIEAARQAEADQSGGHAAEPRW